MNSPLVIPVIFIGLFFGVILTMFLASIRRGVMSRSSWIRTTGRIKTFGVSHGIPSVTYEYRVDDAVLTGRAIVPGPFSGKSEGIALPKSVYLHPDGTLKFPPDAEVSVYHHPQNRADAILVPGVQPGIWKGLAVVISLAMALGLLWKHGDWLLLHKTHSGSAAFFLFGLFVSFIGGRHLKRGLRTRKFPSTVGRLLKADVVYVRSGKNGGGYTPQVEFEYRVGSKLYQSSQLTALPATVLKSQSSGAEAMLERLRSQPEITVYYDPQAPWDGFLLPGPSWGIILPMLMGVMFFGMALFLGSLR